MGLRCCRSTRLELCRCCACPARSQRPANRIAEKPPSFLLAHATITNTSTGNNYQHKPKHYLLPRLATCMTIAARDMQLQAPVAAPGHQRWVRSIGLMAIKACQVDFIERLQPGLLLCCTCRTWQDPAPGLSFCDSLHMQIKTLFTVLHIAACSMM